MPVLTRMKLLVALDTSEKAEVALGPAVELAKAARAEFALLNVFNPRVDMGYIVAPTQEEREARMTAERREYLRAKAGALEGVTAHILVEKRRRGEEVAEAIARVAAEYGADILVVASKRASSVVGVLLGSTAQALLHLSPCPVLVVRPE